jgi:transmembrane sensor
MQNNDTDRIWELISRKLSGEASADELVELGRLLKEHPEQAYSLEIMEDLWRSDVPVNRQYAEYKYKELLLRMQQMDLITEDGNEEKEHLVSLLNADDPKKQKVYGIHKIAKLFLIAASVILVITSVVLLYFENSKMKTLIATIPKKKEIVTKNATKTNLVLPDGTKVWLNSDSKLSYDNTFGNIVREVVLTGEAYFDVTKNANKPFIIHTRKMDIKVLGTAFNVRCYPDEKKVETSLLRGSIEVTLKDRPTEKIYLKPNEKLTLIDEPVVVSSIKNVVKKLSHETVIPEPMVAISHLTYSALDNSVIETSWLQNKLVFKSETFEGVAKKMEKWYNVSIVFSDESVKNLHFTGIFEKETISEALSAMQITTPFHFSINKKELITISK